MVWPNDGVPVPMPGGAVHMITVYDVVTAQSVNAISSPPLDICAIVIPSGPGGGYCLPV